MYLCSKPRGSVDKWILAQFKKLIHPYCWGTSDRFKGNFTRTRKDQILDFFFALRNRLSRRFLKKPTTKVFMAHFAGSLILYFQANGSKKVPLTVVMIDIDCHDRGTFEGAVRCVEWLWANGFPGLFWCRSTNGRGIHAYVIVEKHGNSDIVLDNALVRWEAWLQYQHQAQGWDIELIEVKGRPPVFAWGKDKYELLNVRLGSLAKVPIDLLDRPEEFMATTRLSIADIKRLALEVPEDWDASAYRSAHVVDSDDDITPDDIRQWKPSTGSGLWCQYVVRMAKTGLVDDDSMGLVVFELAKWLLHVELHGRSDCQDHATELLQAYVLAKHNGHVSRLNEGREAEVLSHVERIVASAVRVSKDSDELFARIREAREGGQYRDVIMIAPLLGGITEPVVQGVGQYNCSTSMFINKETPLPPALEAEIKQIAQDQRMRLRNGEYPLVRYARRLLNTLWQRGGTVRLSNDNLTRMLGTFNPNQELAYRRLLQEGGLIREGDGHTDHLVLTWEVLHGESLNTIKSQRSGYQPGVLAKQYSLAERVMGEFEGYSPRRRWTPRRSPWGALEP